MIHNYKQITKGIDVYFQSSSCCIISLVLNLILDIGINVPHDVSLTIQRASSGE